MNKQDVPAMRNVMDVERKYGKTFAETMGLAQESKKTADEASEQAKKTQSAVDGIDHEKVFQLLTENGTQQGIFKKDGKIYVNIEFLKGGTIAAELIDGSTLIITEGSTIAGWNIDDNSIFNKGDGLYKNGTFMSTGTGNKYSIGGSGEITGWVFGAGGKFGVTKDGAVYANDVHLQGEIDASGGTIGDWDIQDGYLTSTRNISVKLTAGTATWEQKAYLEPDGIRIVLKYIAGNPIPTIKELENKIYWYQLAGLNVSSAFEE